MRLEKSWLSVQRGAGALLLAAAVLGAAGCQPGEAGAALITNTERVSAADLEARVRQVLDERTAATGQPAQPGQDGEAAVKTVRLMLVQRVFAQAGRDLGVTVTQGEADRKREEILKQIGPDRLRAGLAGENVPAAEAGEYFRFMVMQDKLAQKLGIPQDQQAAGVPPKLLQALSRAAAELQIRLNPRYGVFNAAKFSFGEPGAELDYLAPAAGLDPGAPQPGQPGQPEEHDHGHGEEHGHDH